MTKKPIQSAFDFSLPSVDGVSEAAPKRVRKARSAKLSAQPMADTLPDDGPNDGAETNGMTSVHFPVDEAQIASAVLAARASKTPITVEGGATKTEFGRPAQTGITISTSKLTGVTLHEPAELVISAKAGTTLAEVESVLASKGQMLPFEPMDYRALLGTTGEPTVGGVVAANLSGPRRIMVGACRDSLIGVRFINGRGEAVKSGGRVMKNVTGLDLARLMAGSWGTLGVLSEVTFKVSPRPEKTATLAFHGLDDARAVALMSAALGSPFEITGAAHLPIGIDRVSTTLLRIEGFEPSIVYRLAALRTLLKAYGPADVIEGTSADKLWVSVRDARFLAEPRDRAVWRVSVAPSKAAAVIAEIKTKREMQHLMDWGGGLIWIATEATGDAGAKVIRAALHDAKGHATLVRAPADIRAATPVFEPLTPAMMVLTSGLKKSFDPDRLFNSGRMYAGI